MFCQTLLHRKQDESLFLEGKNGQRAGEEEGSPHEHPPRLAFLLWLTCHAQPRGTVCYTVGVGEAHLVEKGLVCSARECSPWAGLWSQLLFAHGLNQAVRVVMPVF